MIQTQTFSSSGSFSIGADLRDMTMLGRSAKRRPLSVNIHTHSQEPQTQKPHGLLTLPSSTHHPPENKLREQGLQLRSDLVLSLRSPTARRPPCRCGFLFGNSCRTGALHPLSAAATHSLTPDGSLQPFRFVYDPTRCMPIRPIPTGHHAMLRSPPSIAALRSDEGVLSAWGRIDGQPWL